MALKITVLSSEGESLQEFQLDAPRIIVGRNHHSEICLPSAAVALRHLCIESDGRQYTVSAESSLNGSMLDGTLLPTQTRFPLREGSVLSLPGYFLKIGFLHGVVSSTPKSDSQRLAFQIIHRALLADNGEERGLTISIKENHEQSARHQLWLPSSGPFSFGRDPENTLSCSDAGVARQCSRFEFSLGQVELTNQGQRSPMFLGDAEISLGAKKRWAQDQLLRIGPVALRLSNPYESYATEMRHAAESKLQLLASIPELHTSTEHSEEAFAETVEADSPFSHSQKTDDSNTSKPDETRAQSHGSDSQLISTNSKEPARTQSANTRSAGLIGWEWLVLVLACGLLALSLWLVQLLM